MRKSKAEIFDITTSKDDQRAAEMRMDGAERLALCLDLMDLAAALSRRQPLTQEDDGIDWIELNWERPSSETESV